MNVYVIDASVVVSAALSQSGVPRQAIAAARAHGRIAMSVAVFQEVTEVLARPKFARFVTDVQRSIVMDLLVSAALWAELAVPDRVNDCRDMKDNIYLDLALAAKAVAIVSGDEDLLVLHPWRSVPVLKPAEFLHWLGKAPVQPDRF